MFDYGYKDTAAFLYFQIFFDFFYTFFSVPVIIPIYAGFSSLFRWCVFSSLVLSRNHTHAHTYAHARTYTHGDF